MDVVPGRVLVVTPHPDDAEGGCGGTMAAWIRDGAQVVIVLCTNGDKGSSDLEITSQELAAVREQEQLEAARALGIKDVVFLRHPDGGLEDNREFRGQVVREIRRHRPDVVMCLDPLRVRGHSHRDHRVSGQATIDAVCTYAWRRHYFPEHMDGQGLQPHAASAVYLWGSEDPDTYVDISGVVELKTRSLLSHASQFPNPEGRGQGVLDRARQVGEQAGLEYAEAFRVILFDRDLFLAG